MAGDAFRIERHGEITVVIPSSDVESLQWDLVEQAAEIIMGPVLQAPESSVIIDLADVKFFGSVFLSLLLRIYKTVVQNGGTLVIAGASNRAKELLKLTSLDTLWAIYDTRAEAMKALNSE